jgi:hypothetical protein
MYPLVIGPQAIYSSNSFFVPTLQAETWSTWELGRLSINWSTNTLSIEQHLCSESPCIVVNLEARKVVHELVACSGLRKRK